MLLLPAGLMASVSVVEHTASAVFTPAAPHPSEAHKLVEPECVLGAMFCRSVFLQQYQRTVLSAALTAECPRRFPGCFCCNLMPDMLRAVSKTALLGLTKALAEELGQQGIRVNCVAPGRPAV